MFTVNRNNKNAFHIFGDSYSSNLVGGCDMNEKHPMGVFIFKLGAAQIGHESDMFA